MMLSEELWSAYRKLSLGKGQELKQWAHQARCLEEDIRRRDDRNAENERMRVAFDAWEEEAQDAGYFGCAHLRMAMHGAMKGDDTENDSLE